MNFRAAQKQTAETYLEEGNATCVSTLVLGTVLGRLWGGFGEALGRLRNKPLCSMQNRFSYTSVLEVFWAPKVPETSRL